MVSRALACTISGMVCACGPADLPPAGQLILHVTTDAPLPSALGPTLDPWEPTPLFDWLRVDLIRPGEDEVCPDCTREFPIQRETVDRGDASIGIAPPPGVEGFRARVRLFRVADRIEGEPPPEGTIDVTVSLPGAAREGIVHASVFMPTEAVGSRVGWPEGVAPAPGPPAPGLVGTWPGARRVACRDPAPEGMVCIPGGAFWFGNPSAGLSPAGSGPGGQRLVVVSPFYLDDREVTVRAFRERVALYGYAGGIWSGNQDAEPDPQCNWFIVQCSDWCNFTLFPGPRDEHPMNCVFYQDLSGFCAMRGATLPTEAQLEYAASGTRGSLYVWGDDEPDCDDAIFERGGAGQMYDLPGACRPPGEIGGTLPAGPEKRGRDRLVLPDGGVVFDLAGNLTEWTADLYQPMHEPCWQRPGVYVDPFCKEVSVSVGEQRRMVGGGWNHRASTLRAAGRATLNTRLVDQEKLNQDLDLFGDDAGFRCAAPATPAPAP